MKKNNKKLLLSIIIILVCGIYKILGSNLDTTYSKEINNTSLLQVYYIDVGQADCILIQNDNKYMLIDAGNNKDGNLLVSYFDSLNINEFEYVVATHPHEDHIGGMDDIINNFKIDKFYMPDAITTTNTFENLLDALADNNMTYTVPTIGETFNLGEALIKVIYTGTDTTDLNNTSIVLKLIFKNTSFLFTGDATSVTENKILTENIKADVLKLGHHGSQYSSTTKFLETVSPSYAIISVGANNSYNHPSNSTIEKLNNLNIKYYRTDELSTILVTSDGNSLDITNFKTNTNGE